MAKAARPISPRQSIAWRLALGLGAVLVVIGVVSATCLWALFDIHGRLHALKRDEERARGVVRLAGAVRDQYAHVAHTIIIGNDSHAALFRDATRELRELAAVVRADVGGGAAPEVDHILEASQQIERLFDGDVLPGVRAGNRTAAAAQHDRILQLAMTAQTEAEKLARHAEASMDDLGRHVRATQHGAILLTIIAHIVALTTAAAIGVYLYRRIARPIATLAEAAARVGAGDMSTAIAVDREDELGALSRTFNEMVAAIREHQKKLLQSERLVGLASMSAGIAHELNNPIGVILGYAKLLNRGGAPDSGALRAIEEEAERCQQVIEGLLDLSRGGLLHTAAVDIRAVVDEVIDQQKRSQHSEVSLRVHGHATVDGDVSKLRQVIANLVRNGVEACGEAGEVVVLIDDTRPGVVNVDVSDSGTGVDPELRERIFEPFFTTKPTGSGLGLPISRAIARAHAGDVAVASTSARGTIIRFTLRKGDTTS